MFATNISLLIDPGPAVLWTEGLQKSSDSSWLSVFGVCLKVGMRTYIRIPAFTEALGREKISSDHSDIA